MTSESFEEAIRLWKNKLFSLEKELARTDSTSKKFELQEKIRECLDNIQRLEKSKSLQESGQSNSSINSLTNSQSEPSSTEKTVNQVDVNNVQAASTHYSQKQVSKNQKKLISKIGVDYTRLQKFLAARRWQDADLETRAVLLKIAGKEREGKLKTDDLYNIPVQDLKIIDHLWVKYSNAHFGFSVQTRLWEASGRNVDRFLNIVGWSIVVTHDQAGKPRPFPVERIKPYETLDFSTSSPRGHLPIFGSIGLKIVPSDFFTRLFCQGYKEIFAYFRDCGL